jgi:plastocyanin
VSRTFIIGIAAWIVAGSLLLAATATAAPTMVVGKVGPGETITLSIAGKKVKKLKAGVAYRFVISDRSSDHDFRLVGPGTNNTLTGEEFRGQRATVLKLRKGTYRFFCAPHADEMRGSFTAACPAPQVALPRQRHLPQP